MVDIVDLAVVRRASVNDAAAARVRATSARPQSLTPLADIDADAWRALADARRRAERLLSARLGIGGERQRARPHRRLGACCLARHTTLIGLLPVVSMRRAYKIPLPALVSAHPYGTLCTPPLDRRHRRGCGGDADAGGAAVRRPRADPARRRARRRGDEGVQHRVARRRLAAARAAMAPARLRSTRRATPTNCCAMRSAAKKLKELRRQRHRLAEHGAVTFDVARTPQDVAAALETS